MLYINLTLPCIDLCFVRPPTLIYFPPSFFVLIVIIGTNFSVLVLGYNRQEFLPWFAWVLWCSCVVTAVFRFRSAHLKFTAGGPPGGGAVDHVGTQVCHP